MADLSPNLWRRAHITSIHAESPRTKTFGLGVDGLYPFTAGQHFSIQIRTPDGQVSARDYSFSSAPSSGLIETTIIRAPYGEVSGWFDKTARVGDEVEISPPSGHYFNWTPSQTEPLLLLAGGVGITPLMSILREHQLQQSSSPLSLIYSARNYEDLCFKSELLAPPTAPVDIVCTLTDAVPEDWRGDTGRINASMLQPHLKAGQAVYICGPAGFVDSVHDVLTRELDVNPEQIKVERFS